MRRILDVCHDKTAMQFHQVKHVSFYVSWILHKEAHAREKELAMLTETPNVDIAQEQARQLRAGTVVDLILPTPM